MKKITLALLSSLTLMFSMVSMGTVHADDLDNIGGVDITLDDGGGSTSSAQPSSQDVEIQYNVLKQTLSPFGWGVFFDTAKFTYFLFYKDDIYNILGGSNEVNKNMLTQVLGGNLGGDKYASMAFIDSKMGYKAITILFAIMFMAIFFFSLWNVKIGEGNITETTTQSHTANQGMGGMGGAGMNNMGNTGIGGTTTSSSSTNNKGSNASGIKLGDIIVKLNDMAKMTAQDPNIAKLAGTLKITLLVLLGMGIAVLTATLEGAYMFLSNLKPLYYMLFAFGLLALFFFAIIVYVKWSFKKLARFVANTDEFTSENLVTEIVIKSIPGLVILGLVGAGVAIIAMLIVAG